MSGDPPAPASWMTCLYRALPSHLTGPDHPSFVLQGQGRSLETCWAGSLLVSVSMSSMLLTCPLSLEIPNLLATGALGQIILSCRDCFVHRRMLNSIPARSISSMWQPKVSTADIVKCLWAEGAKSHSGRTTALLCPPFCFLIFSSEMKLNQNLGLWSLLPAEARFQPSALWHAWVLVKDHTSGLPSWRSLLEAGAPSWALLSHLGLLVRLLSWCSCLHITLLSVKALIA